MPIVMDNTLNEIRSTAASGGDRVGRAKRLAELIRNSANIAGSASTMWARKMSRSSRGAARARQSIRRSSEQRLTGAAIEQKKP